jgi:hypothetical protein
MLGEVKVLIAPINFWKMGGTQSNHEDQIVRNLAEIILEVGKNKIEHGRKDGNLAEFYSEPITQQNRSSASRVFLPLQTSFRV